MLEGAQPRWPVLRLVATVLSQRLQQEVTVTECGFLDREPTGDDPHDGLTCLTVEEIDAHHYLLLREPAVDRIADLISAALARTGTETKSVR